MSLHQQWLNARRPDIPVRSPRMLFRERRSPSLADDIHLTPSQHYGVLPQEEYMAITGNKVVLNLAGADNMKHVEPDDFIIHLRSFQGGIEHSRYSGKVSNAYTVLAPMPGLDPRYFRWVLKAPGFIQELNHTTEQLRDGQSIKFDQFATIGLPLPSLEEQHRIADFLDDQVARIDTVIRLKSSERNAVWLLLANRCWAAVSGAAIDAPRKPSRIDWLGSVPADWHVVSVGSSYEVLLGKMLDESRFTGDHATPYLRNTNVQWDAIDTNDIKVMDIAPHERERFTVKTGDLLICEGGHPGRAAIWTGESGVMGFQKALHRARGRRGNDVRWLLNILRVASHVNAFSASTGQTTIGHLTGEQLRELKIPLPPIATQKELMDSFDIHRQASRRTVDALERSMDLFSEYKRSLITAALTGELDVTTARRGIPA